MSKIITRKFLEKFCEGKLFTLSEKADKIIAAVNRKEGNCPCRLQPTPCPCPMHEKEIEERGQCTCNLFVRRKDTKK